MDDQGAHLITMRTERAPTEGGVSKVKIAEMKVALRELGMSTDVHIGRER